MTSKHTRGEIRIVPYMQSDRYPTRCMTERYENTDCYGREYWRPLNYYDTEAAARAALSMAEAS